MFRCGFSGGGAVQSLRSFCLKTGGPFCVKKRKIHRPGGSRLSEDSSGNLSDSCLAERKKSVRDPPVSEIPSALPEICHGVIKWPMAMRQHDAIRPQDRVDGRCSGKKNGQTNKIHLSILFGGASVSRTLAPVSRPIAFRVFEIVG